MTMKTFLALMTTLYLIALFEYERGWQEIADNPVASIAGAVISFALLFPVLYAAFWLFSKLFPE